MSTELKSGPLPADVEEVIANIMREEGVNFLTSKILRLRLEARYRMEFTSHKAAIEGIITKLMQLPEFKKQLENAVKEEKAASSIGGKKKKRSASAAADERNAKVNKKEKKPDDYPKAALSPYILFGNDHRDKVKEQNPEMKNTEILQSLGKMWAEASDAVKEKYKKLAEDDKKRFDRELSEYKKSGGTEYKRGGGKVKAKDENAPKRSMSAYFFFVSDFRKKHPDLSVTETSKAAGAAWKELSDEMKKPYEAMAQKDKERYQREMAARAS
ncbi:High mobility group protein TDP1 [Trypanosoma cruzi]|uniref:High mobility group protein, putative n=2 Tax=Trypanosoma cruzi TaxID=5693 RepID=Q4D714_TRYCC|nr:high mobility group protein, putative [Trypanosoma cruzi]EAN88319.1 high mobility group protein, putative [Trypanosoma cruzi]KAF5221411.1 High mobility group protein TDP1 [Trypanosoma cruzi]PWV07876.1 High mobility group protein TDP1 [Trypanosoma cruzi]RNC59672.1 high mobility group protein [Trypanosoma cruzi]|eukprot:XP_810170.1 high mobility group protein [Trypanosoma cruzi strain CL Brener]